MLKLDRFFKNKKGQAFDVFRLLIAAIIAVAILAILFNVLNIIKLPAGEADQVINQVVERTYQNAVAGFQASSYEQVQFEPGDVIVAGSVAAKASGRAEDICFAYDSGFGTTTFTIGSTYLRFEKNTPQKFSIRVICGNSTSGYTTISDFFDAAGEEYDNYTTGTYTEECLLKEGTSCYVLITPPR